MNTLRRLVLRFLNFLLRAIYRREVRQIAKERYANVAEFVYKVLPERHPEVQEMTVIEGGRFNYFPLQDGSAPKFDFVITQIPLFVVIGDVASASRWEDAKGFGVDWHEWEAAQANLALIEQGVHALRTDNYGSKVHLLLIRWDDPTAPEALYKRFLEDQEEGVNDVLQQ